MFKVNVAYTVQPRLSGPHLSRLSIIQTNWRPLPHMHRRRGQWSFVGVVTSWVMTIYGLCRLSLGKTGLLDYFSEHCWPWSYCIGIVYGLGIINQVRNHFTYLAWQWSACGQRGLDNRGCTVSVDIPCNWKIWRGIKFGSLAVYLQPPN